jgi:predicted DNA-binding transcriptional regulator AlpA
MNDERKQRALSLQKERRKLKDPFANVDYESIKDNVIDRNEIATLTKIKKTTLWLLLTEENAPSPIYKLVNTLLYPRTETLNWLKQLQPPKEIKPRTQIKRTRQTKQNKQSRSFNQAALSFVTRRIY